MILNLNKDHLKGLIDFAKNEVLDDRRAVESLMQNLGTLYNNEMNLHRVMMSTLAHAGQVSMQPPMGAFPTAVKDDIPLAFSVTDPLSSEVMEKLRKQATYFACFSNSGKEYPSLVCAEARDILRVKTETALFNDLDLRFANIAVMMELLNRDTVNYGEGHFTLVSEPAKNGNQSYSKTTLKFFSPHYTANVYEVEKSVYSYNIRYTYLDHVLNNNVHFSNSDGNQVVYLPEGLLTFLDNCIQALYKEYNGAFQSLKQMVGIKVEFVARHMATIYDTCMGKFSPEDNLTHPEKMQAVSYFIREHLQYNRNITMHGHKVAEIGQFDVDVSEDNELIIFGTQVHTFAITNEVRDQSSNVHPTYEKKKLRFEFNHVGVSNVVEELENEDDNVLLFNLWVLNAFEKEFQSIVSSAQHIDVLRKFGRTY